MLVCRFLMGILRNIPTFIAAKKVDWLGVLAIDSVHEAFYFFAVIDKQPPG